MQYVIIGFGYKEIIEAPNAVEAFAAALGVADRERLDSWLLYDRDLNLIADGSGGSGAFGELHR